MDHVIAALPAEADDDLALCLEAGCAYQVDQSDLVSYDESYFNKCAGYEGQQIALAINAGRVALVDRHVGGSRVLDVGIGSGEFIKNRSNTWGTDVNPAAVRWLKDVNRYAQTLRYFCGYTFWDVIEHVPTPKDYFDCISPGAYLFTSIPIFEDLRRIRDSKHYRPGEHLYYWTEEGFVRWMSAHGFTFLERDDFESRAGRDRILSFAFRRD